MSVLTKPKKARTGRNELRDREPPHSAEAEQGVLGSIIQSAREVMPECAEKIRPEFFYVPAHRTIYQALLDMHDAGDPIDLATFTIRLRERNLLASVGGAAFVTELFSFVPTSAHVEYYLDIVRDHYVLRETVAACIETVWRAYGINPHMEGAQSPLELWDALDSKFVSLRSLHELDGAIPGVSLVDLAEMDPEGFRKDILLGERWLCRKGGALLVSTTGVGKSSSGVQQDVSWALGRPAFGIRPPQPLKILCVQAENDDADLAEMSRDVMDELQLSEDDRKQVRRNVIYVPERGKTGAQFLRYLRKLVKRFRPDLIRIDVLHAYIGGDIKDSEVLSAFLRNGLNPILDEFDCGVVIQHHTTKPIWQDRSNWSDADYAYAAAGGAELANWARAILVIEQKGNIYVFRAAKRGSRIGWADDEGKRVFQRLFSWHPSKIFWREATKQEVEQMLLAKRKQGGRDPLRTKEELKALVPMDEPIPKNTLLNMAQIHGFGRDHARALLEELLSAGELYQWPKPREKARPEWMISRQEQTLI